MVRNTSRRGTRVTRDVFEEVQMAGECTTRLKITQGLEFGKQNKVYENPGKLVYANSVYEI